MFHRSSARSLFATPASARTRVVTHAAPALLWLALAQPAASAQCTPQETTKLLASDAAANDLFGHGLALSGDLALVGGYANDDSGSGSGSAYLFQRGAANQWSEIKK